MKKSLKILFILIFLIILSVHFCIELSYAEEKKQARSVKYILFKLLDKDSSRAINSAAITVNKSIFISTSPSGIFKLDISSKELEKFEFLDIEAMREGYYNATAEVSIKEPSKIPQPVKVYMKQKMGVLNGVITGCWNDKDGHYNDSYSEEDINVFGTAVSSQHIIYKFKSDDKGNFKIFNLPIGTYEIDIRHKKWPVYVETPEKEISMEFNIRKCGREQYHKKTETVNNKKDALVKDKK